MASQNPTTQAQPSGPWGAFPVPDLVPGFRPYAFALVQSDGTVINQSDNITVVHQATGEFFIRPKVRLTAAQSLAICQPMGGAPFVFSITYGVGPDAWDLQILIFNSATQAAADGNFLFLMWLPN